MLMADFSFLETDPETLLPKFPDNGADRFSRDGALDVAVGLVIENHDG
jgi:hypothetical protein